LILKPALSFYRLRRPGQDRDRHDDGGDDGCSRLLAHPPHHRGEVLLPARPEQEHRQLD